MAQCTDTNNCIEVNDLKMHFKLKSGLFSKPKVLKAVDGVSFSIEKGRTMGLGNPAAARQRLAVPSLNCTRQRKGGFCTRERTSPD